jgi:hypothetical protein
MSNALRRVREIISMGHNLKPNESSELVELIQRLDLNYRNLELILESQLIITRSRDFFQGNVLRKFLLSFISHLQESNEKPESFRQFQIASTSKFEHEVYQAWETRYTNNPKHNWNCLRLKKQESDFLSRLRGLEETPREANSRISKLIHGRKVLLLGPSPVDESQLPHFKEFDVVAHMNIKSDKRMNPNFPGDLPKIIYLNGQLTESFRTENYLKSLDSKSIIVRRNPFKNRYLENSPETFNINLLQYSTPLLMAPRALMDLISYNPAEIEIHGVDFYCSPIKYFEGFKKLSHESLFQIFEHDLVSSFNFMRFLILQSKVSINYNENNFNFVMSTDSFFELLARNFSKPST